MLNYTYDANFFGNILIVGRTGYGKTYFTQKLVVNNFFGTLKKIEWVSSIEFGSEREAEIESCFSCDIDFHDPNGLETFNDLLEEFKARSNTAKTKALDTNLSGKIVNSGFGEETKRDQLIVMDDVPGLADELRKFASFLTVAHKFDYNFVYIFHTYYPGKTNWKTILSQTNIFNIFPASVSLASVWSILENTFIRKTKKYIPQSALWISRLFIQLANRDDRVCLTLEDCSSINKDGPGRFRTDADKPDVQTCYYNPVDDEQVYNAFVSKRINTSKTNDRIQFKIIHLKSKTNREENFDATVELHNLSRVEKKRATTIFDAGTKSIEKSSGYGKRSRAKPKFLLGQ